MTRSKSRDDNIREKTDRKTKSHDPNKNMFAKLKLKIILTNMLTSAAVLLAAFIAIYFVVSNDFSNRPSDHIKAPTTSSQPNSDFNESFDETTQQYFEQRLHDDRKASLSVLLTSLIITGISIEICIALLSIFLAEQAIHPVREAYEAQKTFIANASHEIKTPLAVIQANLEAADIKGNHWIDNVAKKTEDLAALNQQLLSLARMDSTPEAEKPESLNLADLVRETADFYLPKAKEKGVNLKISLKIPENFLKNLPRADLTQILNILIDNAVKYSEKKIQITVENSKISVKNDGATIAKQDLAHIFDRFYQTDKTKSGVGLGLAIAKQVATRHKWKLKADSTAKNTTFTIEF